MLIPPQDRLPNFLDLLLDAVFLVDIEGRVVYASAACERILGYTPAELVGRSMINLVVPEDRARTVEEAKRVIAGQARIGFENRYIKKDGSDVCLMWSARLSEADQLRVGVARDVSEQKSAEERQAATYAVSEAAHAATDLATLFREIHRILEKLVPVAALIVATRDRKTGELRFPYQKDSHGNPAGVKESAAREYCAEVVHRGSPMVLLDDALAAAPEDAAATRTGASWLVMPLITQEKVIGALILQSHPGAAYTGQDEDLLHFVSAQVATAIERKQLNAELLHVARHDDLTGLPNRRLFQDRIEASLAHARRRQARVALLYLDIDNFKDINDTHGHACGDLLLLQVAQRLTHSVREADTVARLGGDEFVVLLEDVGGPDDACIVMDKIRAAVRQPMDLDGHVAQTWISVGVAIFPEHGTDADQLMKHADKSMYTDKKTRMAQP